MDIDSATSIAQAFLDIKMPSHDGNDTVVLYDDPITKEDGWYFEYQSLSYIQSGDINKSLVGNTPIFVDLDGRVGFRMFDHDFIPDR